MREIIPDCQHDLFTINSPSISMKEKIVKQIQLHYLLSYDITKYVICLFFGQFDGGLYWYVEVKKKICASVVWSAISTLKIVAKRDRCIKSNSSISTTNRVCVLLRSVFACCSIVGRACNIIIILNLVLNGVVTVVVKLLLWRLWSVRIPVVFIWYSWILRCSWLMDWSLPMRFFATTKCLLSLKMIQYNTSVDGMTMQCKIYKFLHCFFSSFLLSYYQFFFH